MTQTPRESTTNEMVTDKSVLLHWDLIMHNFDTPVSDTYTIALHCGVL